MVIYLVDTCIWRDFYEDRFSSDMPIGRYATEFFMKVLKRKDKILFSRGLLKELSKDYSEMDIDDMLRIFMYCDILVRIDITVDDMSEAESLSDKRNLPLIDCLNAVQARNHDAVLVTRDMHYFKELDDIMSPVRPEDVI
jgi:predicted nucleic acid-binding protein